MCVGMRVTIIYYILLLVVSLFEYIDFHLARVIVTAHFSSFGSAQWCVLHVQCWSHASHYTSNRR